MRGRKGGKERKKGKVLMKEGKHRKKREEKRGRGG